MSLANNAELPESQPSLSATGRKWFIREQDPRTALSIAQSLGVPEIVARILAGRGFTTETTPAFLAPSLRASMPDPSRFQDMDKAAANVADAIVGQKKIAVFADYDVDGATSSAIVRRFIRACGLEALLYIPDRFAEGYGPSADSLKTLANEGAEIVIMLDCGTTAFDPIAAGTALGLRIIVIDHHVAEPQLPDAFAVINPNRLDEDGAYGHLCSAGLAFMFIVALNRALRTRGFWTNRSEPDLLRWLDLVALGTVCDVVKLEGLNRAFVAQGLKVLAGRENPGLRALADIAGLNSTPEGYHLGFILGPRINAGGRIGKSDLGANLLATDDVGEAVGIATHLDSLNAERKAIEADVHAQAMEMALAQPAERAVTVVAAPGWHAGVIGIVASRLVERFHKPACVLAIDGDVATGSGRSISGVDLGAAVIAARQKGILIKGGGHAMAAGFSVPSNAIDEFAIFMGERITDAGIDQDVTPTMYLDGAISARGAGLELAKEIATLAPFGPGNPEPRLIVHGVRVQYIDVVGKDHLRMTLSAASGGGRLDAICFRCVGTPLGAFLQGAGGTLIAVAGRLKIDTWQGRTKVKFHIEDAKAGSDDTAMEEG